MRPYFIYWFGVTGVICGYLCGKMTQGVQFSNVMVLLGLIALVCAYMGIRSRRRWRSSRTTR